MHLASLEQQRELMRYMNSLNEWLGHDVEDRQAELRGVSARMDQLRDDLNSLGVPRGPCKLYHLYMPHILIYTLIYSPLVPPPGPGVEPGGFIVPGGAPGAPGFRPGTVPPGGPFVPPPPQVSFPQPSQQYGIGVMPPVMPRPYRTPSPSGSPVFPSPPSRDGGAPFIPPDLGPARGSMAIPPQVYQPPIPMGDDEIYIPPEPSYSSRSPSIESPRSPSSAPVFIPGPQIGPQQPPPIFLHPPSQPPPSQLGRTPSPQRSTPPPTPGQPTIIVPPQQPGGFPPTAPLAPSTQYVYDERPDQPVLLPGAQPPFQVVASPRPGRSPSDFDGRREGFQQPGQQPIIIHPPSQTHITPSPYGHPGPGIIVPPSHPRSRSTTPSTRSPGPSVIAAPFPPTVYPGPGAPFPGAPFPGAPFPVGVPLPGPMPGVGFPPGAPPITVVAPSRASPEPEYRSPRDSPRQYPESPRLYPESRAPSRYAEGPYQPVPPPMPIPTVIPGGFPGAIPTAVHIEHDPDRYRRGARYPESRTPSSRSPSIGPERREPERDRDRRHYRSPSPEYPVPIGVGPEYDRGVGPTVIQPPPVTHVHQYPSTYAPQSRTTRSPSPPFTEREGEPLPHHFGPPTQYPPTEQAPMPIGRPPTRSRAPTIVEVTGPEPIQVYPPPDHRRQARKRCI